MGLTTLALFMMHGAIYLLMKTEGRLYAKLTILLKRGIIAFIILFSITSLYTLIYIPHLSDDFRETPALFIVPVLAFLSIANIPRLATKRKFRQAFFFSALSIAFLLVLVAVEIFPIILLSTTDPAYSLDIYNAASSEKSLGIMLLFAAIGIPLVSGYTFFVYKTFAGKVELDETSY
jgi:cytochrome d ubiquinol oxidase subunit II